MVTWAFLVIPPMLLYSPRQQDKGTMFIMSSGSSSRYYEPSNPDVFPATHSHAIRPIPGNFGGPRCGNHTPFGAIYRLSGRLDCRFTKPAVRHGPSPARPGSMEAADTDTETLSPS